MTTCCPTSGAQATERCERQLAAMRKQPAASGSNGGGRRRQAAACRGHAGPIAPRQRLAGPVTAGSWPEAGAVVARGDQSSQENSPVVAGGGWVALAGGGCGIGHRDGMRRRQAEPLRQQSPSRRLACWDLRAADQQGSEGASGVRRQRQGWRALANGPPQRSGSAAALGRRFADHAALPSGRPPAGFLPAGSPTSQAYRSKYLSWARRCVPTQLTARRGANRLLPRGVARPRQLLAQKCSKQTLQAGYRGEVLEASGSIAGPGEAEGKQQSLLQRRQAAQAADKQLVHRDRVRGVACAARRKPRQRFICFWVC